MNIFLAVAVIKCSLFCFFKVAHSVGEVVNPCAEVELENEAKCKSTSDNEL